MVSAPLQQPGLASLQPGLWTLVVADTRGGLVYREEFPVLGTGTGQQGGILQDRELEILARREGEQQSGHSPAAAELLSEYFSVLDRCSAGGQAGLQDCSGMAWSSLSPDPKSEILGVHPDTGHLL